LTISNWDNLLKSNIKKFRINNQIRAREVRVVDEVGKNLGVMKLEEALKMAFERHLDLVEIAPKVNPPVVKIIDYGKFLYWQRKKEKEKKKQQKELKCIRIGFKESEHDLDFKVKKISEFLENGHQVRIDLILKGREKAFKDQAIEKIKNFLEKIKVNYKIIQEPKKVPRGISTMIVKK